MSNKSVVAIIASDLFRVIPSLRSILRLEGRPKPPVPIVDVLGRDIVWIADGGRVISLAVASLGITLGLTRCPNNSGNP